MIRHNLSISNSKKVFLSGKKGKGVFLILTSLVFLGLGNKVLNYLYVQDNNWARIRWHDFYEQEKNIDNIYLGSSHVHYDLNPEILDEKNGKNNFNMATDGQRLIESYYLLKEAARCNKIENVYLELYYELSTGVLGDYQEKDSVQIGWRTMDYMKWSFNKVETLFSINPVQYYPEAFFPFIRYRAHLMEGNWIKERVNYKGTENYKNYIYYDEYSEYKDKGYCYTTVELTNLLFGRDRKPEEMYLTADAEQYLRNIIEYCQKRNLQITLFSSPCYEIKPIATENYDWYADRIKEIALEYGIAYYDFNIVKEEYLPIQHPKYYWDVGHLNADGAKLYTSFFYQVVSEDSEDNAEYFYDSYKEKLEYSKPNVYGIYYYDMDESELNEGDEPVKMRRMVVASNRKRELEYRILLTPEGEETILLQDFSINKEFNISPEEHGCCEVIWRNRNSEEESGRMEVQY